MLAEEGGIIMYMANDQCMDETTSQRGVWVQCRSKLMLVFGERK
jgi:hypothetical protein